MKATTNTCQIDRRTFHAWAMGGAAAMLGPFAAASPTSSGLLELPEGTRIAAESLRTDRSFTRAACIVEKMEGTQRRAVSSEHVGPMCDILNDIYISPDGTRIAYPSQRGGRSILTLDQHEVDEPGQVATDSATFSPDSKTFFHSRSTRGFGRSRAYAFANHEMIGAYAMVFKAAFSSDSSRLVFTAADGGRAVVIENGLVIDRHPALPGGLLGPHPPVFSADSTRLGIVAAGRAGAYVVIDGEVELPYSRIGGLAFAPQGKRYGYIGIDRGSTTVVIDGRRVGVHKLAHSQIEFTPDGEHFAYSALDSFGNGIIVKDGKQYARGPFAQSPTFSPDGKRLAYWGGDGRGKQVVVDGQELPRAGEIATRILFSPDSSEVAYVAKDAHRGTVAVYRGEKKLGDWEAVRRSSLAFSPDSEKLVWLGKRDGEWRAVVDGEPATEALDAVAACEETGTQLLTKSSFVHFPEQGKLQIVAVSAGGRKVVRRTIR